MSGFLVRSFSGDIMRIGADGWAIDKYEWVAERAAMLREQGYDPIKARMIAAREWEELSERECD